MKKLMIAACAVAFAAAAQAATYNWNFSTDEDGGSLLGPSSEKTVNGTMTIYAYDAVNCTQQMMWETIAAGGSLDSFAAYAASPSIDVVNGNIVADEGKKYARVTTSGEGLEEQALFAVVVSGNNIFFDDEDSYTTTELPAGTDVALYQGWAGDSDYDFTKAGKDQAWDQTGWYSTAAVPEPTSGLLLLLGVAGLALRRRRA